MRNGNRDHGDNVNMFMNTSVLRCVSFSMTATESVVMIQHSAQFHLGPILTASCGCCRDDASTSSSPSHHPPCCDHGSNGHAAHADDSLDHDGHVHFIAIIYGP